MEKRHILGRLGRKTKKKSAGAAVLAVCLALLIVLIGAVIGRYQHQLRSDGAVRAKEFYFTSNLLDGKTHTLAPGSTEVSFTLGNHADELRCSEVDISYTVTVTPSTTGMTVDGREGILNQGAQSDATVTIKGLTAGTYNVKAVGTGGYSKTLTATIVVPKKEAQLYQHQDNVPGEYLLLTVWNEGDEAGTVTIEYDGIPDNTNPNMTDWTTGTETAHSKKENILIPAHASMVFRFFESGTIIVTKDGTEIVEKSQLPN